MIAGLILSSVLAGVPTQLATAAAGRGNPPVAPGTPAPSAPAHPDAAFSHLFQGGSQREVKPQPKLQFRTRERSKVVCGMTLILVGPEVDPKRPKPPSKDSVTYTMRRYPPPACGQDVKTEEKKR